MYIHATPYQWPHDGDLSETTALVIIDMQKDFCSPGGYLDHQGCKLAPMRAPIPHISRLLTLFRHLQWPIFFTREGHLPDMTDVTSRELFRSRNNPSGLGSTSASQQTFYHSLTSSIGIGSPGPLGRLLIRGEPGHDIIPELCPLPSGEPIIDKPGRSAFQYTDFELLLNVKGVRKLVVTGVTTDVCISTTLRDADDRGFECLLVKDACAATVEALHTAAVEMIGTEGGIFGAVAKVDEVVGVLEGILARRKI